MQTDSFNVFWSKVILPYCHQFYDDLPANVVNKYQVRLDVTSVSERAIYNTYEKYRKEVHERYFDNTNHALIDKHKICSCLMGALVKCRLVSYTVDAIIPSEVFLVNYKIAFFSGVKALFLLNIAECTVNEKMKIFADALVNQKMFKFPKTHPGHDEYSVGRVKALALTDSFNGHFDILAYADMLYWIEKFNIENVFRLINQSDV